MYTVNVLVSLLVAICLRVIVWARHLDGRLSVGHLDIHGNCEGPTALAGADRHRAAGVVHAPSRRALAMRSGDGEPSQAQHGSAAPGWRAGCQPAVAGLQRCGSNSSSLLLS